MTSYLKAVPRKSILIVEDNPLNMKLLHDILATQGYDIYESPTGADVLELAHSLQPDLIIMDILLPQISGMDIAQSLKKDKTLKDIPILAVTAFALKEEEEKIMKSGCDGYISKPISLHKFIDTVKIFLEKK